MTSHGCSREKVPRMRRTSPGEHPPHQTHRVRSLVVAQDGDVHVAQRRVRVAQSNGWQVHVRGFREGLVVSPGIGDHQKPWLPERGLALPREGSIRRCPEFPS